MSLESTAATADAASSTSSLCANCDCALAPHFSFSCADCDADSTPCCIECSVQLHQPAKRSRHQLTRRSTEQLPAGDPQRDEGHGFCSSCVQRSSQSGGAQLSPLKIQLAVLECEGCATEGGRQPKSLCLDCDQLVHQSLDADAHTRLTFTAAAPARQTGLFTLGGVENLRIMHADRMESYAGRIWPGSLLLSRYCEQWVREEGDSVVRGKKIIELGCGCAAIPTITCMLLGAKEALCTDMNEDGLEILEENILNVQKQLDERYQQDQTQPQRSVVGMRTQRLSFGEEVPQELRGAFDIILGSYILYDPDSFLPLVRTLEQLCPLRTEQTSSSAASSAASPPSCGSPVILLTSHEPTREHSLLSALTAADFSWTRIAFSLRNARVTEADETDGGGVSNIGTGLRSTSILRVQRKDR
jgi:predicted nicotinamide N-methyase